MLRNPMPVNPYTTPLAAPPPPLHLLPSQGRSHHPHHNLPAYAGARHTLGPTFSEEEDGDDTQFIAEQMRNLGIDLNRNGGQPQPQLQGQRDGNYDRRSHTPQSQRSRRRQPTHHPQGQHHGQQYRNTRDQNVSPYIHQNQTQYPDFGHGVNRAQQEAAYHLLQQKAQESIRAAMSHSQQYDLAQRGQLEIQRLQQQQYLLQQQQHQQQHSHFLPSPAAQPLQQFASPSDQRTQLAAQVHANLAARNRRQQDLADPETRARFESVPEAGDALRSPFTVTGRSEVSAPTRLPALPFVAQDTTWSAFSSSRSSQPQAETPVQTQAQSQAQSNATAPAPGSAFGRFSHVPTSSISKPQSTTSLTNLLGRRAQTQPAAPVDETDLPSTESSKTNTTAQTSPVSSTTSEFEAGRAQISDSTLQTPATVQGTLGLGRPRTNVSALAAVHKPIRAWSSPSLHPQTPANGVLASTPRSASQPSAGFQAIRQPFGPPGDMVKLKEENFKALIRKQAGLKLGMLNRRVSPPTPAISLPLAEE